MPKLSELKKKHGAIPAFVTYEFRGQDDMFVLDGKPLTVELTPPSQAFILESGQITSLILRYSNTWQEQLGKITDNKEEALKTLEGKPEIAQQIMAEMRERISKSEDEQSRMIGIIVKLGKEYLIQKAIYGHYGDRSEKFRVEFTPDKEAADEWNAKYPDDDSKLVLWVDSLEDNELVSVGLKLIDAMPKGIAANIPLASDAINPTNAELEKGVTDSVPANAVASFPRNLRSLAVEDVPESSGGSVGDSGKHE